MNKAPSTPRIKFVTKDGVVVMNRETEKWVVEDRELIPFTLGHDARNKGVRVLSWKVDPSGIQAVVEWA